MTEPLQAIAYLSTATKALGPGDIEALLASARLVNERAGVTGALLLHGATFFQYIEGPPAALQDIYARIRRCSLHSGLLELFNQPVAQREFGEWFMGFADAPPSLMLRLEQARWTRLLEDRAGLKDPGEGLALLLEFWRSARRYAPGPVRGLRQQ
jgi:hypothetical protein